MTQHDTPQPLTTTNDHRMTQHDIPRSLTTTYHHHTTPSYTPLSLVHSRFLPPSPPQSLYHVRQVAMMILMICTVTLNKNMNILISWYQYNIVFSVSEVYRTRYMKCVPTHVYVDLFIYLSVYNYILSIYTSVYRYCISVLYYVQYRISIVTYLHVHLVEHHKMISYDIKLVQLSLQLIICINIVWILIYPWPTQHVIRR